MGKQIRKDSRTYSRPHRDIPRPDVMNLQGENISMSLGFSKSESPPLTILGNSFQKIFQSLESSFVMVILAKRACPLMML